MDYNQRYYGNDMYDDVYYIDTRRTSSGWKKGCHMTTPRDKPYAMTVDDLHKMYVFGGNRILRSRDYVTPWAEVFDSKIRVLGCDKSCFPQTGYNYDDIPTPQEFLVSLGNSKLAVIWSGYRDGYVASFHLKAMSQKKRQARIASTSNDINSSNNNNNNGAKEENKKAKKKNRKRVRNKKKKQVQ
ncbi:hypothetical protein RHMOL_Rhmol01G0006700 [Rhododendron molle]|uniref:Uncharacterized protein n=1 Tax=Rhododendron molle TaxID=49168 RepID=A0ACC0PY35_RHOML|nr:hypothetical protein RHMOL_Rhmol01G0006700 [Rhododendron molle]